MREPWASWLQAAVLRFGLTPEAFWRLSLCEWRALTRAVSGTEPMTRAGLEALLKQDREAGNDEHRR